MSKGREWAFRSKTRKERENTSPHGKRKRGDGKRESKTENL